MSSKTIVDVDLVWAKFTANFIVSCNGNIGSILQYFSVYFLFFNFDLWKSEDKLIFCRTVWSFYCVYTLRRQFCRWAITQCIFRRYCFDREYFDHLLGQQNPPFNQSEGPPNLREDAGNYPLAHRKKNKKRGSWKYCTSLYARSENMWNNRMD